MTGTATERHTKKKRAYVQERAKVNILKESDQDKVVKALRYCIESNDENRKEVQGRMEP